MGTDAAQVMRQDLGSGKPMLHYQEVPVFVSDFVSNVEPVHKVHSTAVTIASTTATTVVLSADISAQISAIMGTVSASNPVYLVARTGAAAKYSKVVLKVTGIAGDTLTVDPSFAITDDEKNRPQSLQSQLAALNTAAGLQGKAASIYERVDGTSIYAGKFGEGDGICGFTLDLARAIQIQYVGPVRERDQDQYRMKFYCGFETYSRLALARLKSVLPLV